MKVQNPTSQPKSLKRILVSGELVRASVRCGCRPVNSGGEIAMIGTARVLLEAKQRGPIKDVAPALQALMDSGYRITRELREQILRIANESV